jgi:hypothetical protein
LSRPLSPPHRPVTVTVCKSGADCAGSTLPYTKHALSDACANGAWSAIRLAIAWPLLAGRLAFLGPLLPQAISGMTHLASLGPPIMWPSALGAVCCLKPSVGAAAVPLLGAPPSCGRHESSSGRRGMGAARLNASPDAVAAVRRVQPIRVLSMLCSCRRHSASSRLSAPCRPAPCSGRRRTAVA